MSLPVCKFYLKSKKCKFGNNCKFLHSVNQNPPPCKTIDLGHDHGEAVNKDQPSAAASSSSAIYFDEPENQHNEELDITEKLASSSLNPTAVEFQFNPKKKYETVKDQKSFKPNTPQRKICKFFAQNGTCAFGEKCFFSHTVHSGSERILPHQNGPSFRGHRSQIIPRDVAPRFQRPVRQKESSERHPASEDKKEKQSLDPNDFASDHFHAPDVHNGKGKSKLRQCYLFKLGRCRWGKQCKFSHDLKERQKVSTVSSRSENQNDKNGKISENSGFAENASNHITSRPTMLKQVGVIELDTLEKEGVERFREQDISYLKKRFPKNSTIIIEDQKSFILQVKIFPSDPDWAFDMTVFNLEFTLPELYPKEAMTVKVLGGEEFPETVQIHMEISIEEWLLERHTSFVDKGKVELVARPFLRWFDRKLEDIVTEALQQLKRELILRAAGIEFISPEKLRARYKNASGRAESEESGSSNEEVETEEDTRESDDDSNSCDDSESEEEDESRLSLNLDPERRGTEICLRHLQLKEKATSLLFERLKLILQCSRCKNHEEAVVIPGRILSTACGKCGHEMLATYRASLAHQFSSVIGYLDLENCTAFDLILQDSKAGVTCLNCSKQTRVDGLVPGHLVDSWCQACNARFKFATEAVKFSQLAPSGVDVSGNTQIEVVRQKTKKPPKDPNIKEGCPLPDFGTCKHYKQSYRWLRFPCCGKAYPCDMCHDKKEDHEMVFANRMICGHCCKEQIFSATRPCKACGESMTKTRTAHWEGGHGCRDKIAMSKNDIQKYKSMNKTISNHKKKVQSAGSKKKTTKLRHA